MPLAADAVEQTASRTRAAKHYTNPDGTFTGAFSTAPIHYKGTQGGAWLDKKQSFRAGPGANEWISDESDVTMRTYQVGSGGNRKWWLQFIETLSGQGVEFEVLGQPTTTAGSNVLSFSDGAARTWTYSHTRVGGKMWGPPMTSSEPATTYTFNYRLLGGAPALSVNAAGDLVCGTIFTMPRSYMLGANRIPYPAGAWSIGSGTVSFTVDHVASGLPAGAYPFRLDPSTSFSVAATLDDQWVYKNATSYPPAGTLNRNTGTTTIWVERGFFSPDYYDSVSVFRWDTSSLDDAWIVTGGTFRGNIATIEGNPDSLSITMDWGPWDGSSASDWSHTPGTNAHAGTAVSTLTTGDKDFTLLSPAANVSKTGTTYIRAFMSQRASDAAPTGGNGIGFAATDHATLPVARLLVDYTTGDTTPPAAPTNLTATLITP